MLLFEICGMIINNLSDFTINRSLQSLSTGVKSSKTLSINFPPQAGGGGGGFCDGYTHRLCVCF
jgi:hypothetical protein